MKNLNFDQLFDGFCPESKLKDRHVKMRLNSNDFYESEETGLQIAISYPGVQATVLKSRGNGKFKSTISYADTIENGEILSPQQSESFPFCSNEVFEDENHFKRFLVEYLVNPQINIEPDMKNSKIPSQIIPENPTPELIDYYLRLSTDCTDVPREFVAKPHRYKELYLASIKNSDKSLRELISAFPKNTVLSEIYLKVVAINSLYSTNIFDTYRLAYHIFTITDFDNRIKKIDSNLVNNIASDHGINNKRLYSFATKYCSWHNMDYPIYDGYIERLLIKYLKIKNIEFNANDFKDYDKFIQIIDKFRNAYTLKYSIKELDKFLWMYAKTLELEEENKKLTNG